jgi:hypothetical protein
MTESGKDKKLVNPVSMIASSAIFGEPMRPTATLMIASQLLFSRKKFVCPKISKVFGLLTHANTNSAGGNSPM